MNANTNQNNHAVDFYALARAFRMPEAQLLAALHRCIHFLPTHFRQFLQGHAYG